MKRSRQLNAQREAKRAMQEVSWSVDDDTHWPFPDRHAGDFGPPDTDSEGGETDVHEGQQA